MHKSVYMHILHIKLQQAFRIINIPWQSNKMKLRRCYLHFYETQQGTQLFTSSVSVPKAI